MLNFLYFKNSGAWNFEKTLGGRKQPGLPYLTHSIGLRHEPALVIFTSNKVFSQITEVNFLDPKVKLFDESNES